MPKSDALRELVAKRRIPVSGTVADGYSLNYKKLGDFQRGAYDENDYVVPWSKSAFNLDADTMVVGQDWASAEFLRAKFDPVQKELGYTPRLAANRNLFFFLQTYFNCEFKDVYATDAFVFVKPGLMSSKLSFADIKKSVVDYLIPQINIIGPRTVLCLGSSTYNAVRVIQGLPHTSIRDSFKMVPFVIGAARIVGLPHTGGSGTAAVGGKAAAAKYWEKAARLKDGPKAGS